jgi:hypothetical protein
MRTRTSTRSGPIPVDAPAELVAHLRHEGSTPRRSKQRTRK